MMSQDGMEDTGYITNETKSLPLNQFEAEVMCSQFADPDPDVEKEIIDRMNYFSNLRKQNFKEKKV